MGKPKRVNVLQTLRMKLKSGYLKEEPKTYTFMKRYPPMHNDYNMILRKTKFVDTRPLTNLYTRAVEKNSLYVDEMVYPAYWKHEPQAFTLAKKQYEYIQSGCSENEAYKKAVAYVDDLENASYLEMKELVAAMDSADAKVPTIASSEKLSSKIALWREKLRITPYESLSLAFKGEIDFIIQTELLKWNEVERERRMRDPVFVAQFEKLRRITFPEISLEADRLPKKRAEFKAQLFGLFNIDANRLKPKNPFFYEDFVHYFNKAKAPYNKNDGRDEILAWILDTLVFADVIAKLESIEAREFLTALRAQFFPMVRNRHKEFSMPSVEQFKQLLYDNDIGYKVVDGKLYVRRFYLIPQLLFPGAFQGGSYSGVGSSGPAQDEDIVKTMKDYVASPESRSRVHERLGVSDAVDNKVVFDKLFSEPSSDAPLTQSFGRQQTEILKPRIGSDFEEPEDDFGVEPITQAKEKVLQEDVVGGLFDTPEWDGLLDKYNIKLPATELEREREALFKSEDSLRLEDSSDEVDLYQFRRTRQENMLLVRARLFAAYEEKEAARRASEWKSRGVWMDLPRADIELLDPQDGKLLRKVYKEFDGQITNSTQL